MHTIEGSQQHSSRRQQQHKAARLQITKIKGKKLHSDSMSTTYIHTHNKLKTKLMTAVLFQDD